MSATSKSLLNAAAIRLQGHDLQSSKQIIGQWLSSILSRNDNIHAAGPSCLQVCCQKLLPSGGGHVFCERQVSHVCVLDKRSYGVYFPVCRSVSLFICPCLSVTANSLYLHLSIRPCLLVHLSLPVSVYLSLAVSLSLSVHLSLFVRLSSSVQLSCTCPRLSVCLTRYICPLSVHPSVSVHLSLSVRLSL